MRFLLLENDVEYSEQLEARLLANGSSDCLRCAFSSVEQAIEHLQDQDFDALLIDWPDQGRHRYDACRRLAAASRPRDGASK